MLLDMFFYRESTGDKIVPRPQRQRLGFACQGAFVLILALTTTCAWQPAAMPQQTGQMDFEGRLKQCREMINSGEYDDARHNLQILMRQQPMNAEVYEVMGNSYLMQGNAAEAEVQLRHAHSLDPSNSNVLNNLGNALYRQNKLSESVDVYKKALALSNPEPWKLYVNLANSLSDLGKINEACDAFSKAIKERPSFAPAYLGLGRMYCDHDKLGPAETNLRNAIKFKPDYANAYFYLGRVLMKKGDYADAANQLKTSMVYEQNPQYRADTQRLYQTVIQHITSGSGAPAANSAPQAVQGANPLALNNSYPPAAPVVDSGESKDKAVDTANTLLRHRDWPSAQRQLEQILSRYGQNDATVWNNLGYARVHQGQTGSTQAYEDAIQDYKQAIKLSKNGFPTAEYNLGQAYRLLNERRYGKQAEESFRQAISDARAARTTCPLAQNALGLMLKQRGDVKGALAAYRMAIAQSGAELPVAHYNLAILLESSDKSREAVHEYMAYLKLKPHGYNAENARVRLKRLGVEPPPERS
ncbi:MAG TPA: tetratricopeptide repeat protein [Trichormus sp.]